MKNIFVVGLAVLVCCFVPEKLHSQQSKRQMGKWYHAGAWLNGLDRIPHSSINKREFSRQYHLNQASWDLAFNYLKTTDFSTVPPGKYPIDGDNVFALVSEGNTKELDKTMWEAHRNYMDIHYVITGSEDIGITPVSKTSLAKGYDETKDIAFYTGDGKYYRADTSNIFIVFPEDAHRPGIKNKTATAVKKVVIKIRKIS